MYWKPSMAKNVLENINGQKHIGNHQWIKCIRNHQWPKKLWKYHIDGLVQDCSISSAPAIEVLKYCIKPLTSTFSTVPADGWAPTGATTSAETVMTTFRPCVCMKFTQNIFRYYIIWQNIPLIIYDEYTITLVTWKSISYIRHINEINLNEFLRLTDLSLRDIRM